MKKINEDTARRAFEEALAQHDQAFERFFLARLLGFEISYPDNTCQVAFTARDFMFNPQGSLHGGVIALAMDVSMGHLLNRLRGPGATLEMKVQYLRPVPEGRAVATGRILRQGASVAFLESRLIDNDGELAAVGTSTWKTSAPSPANGDSRVR